MGRHLFKNIVMLEIALQVGNYIHCIHQVRQKKCRTFSVSIQKYEMANIEKTIHFNENAEVVSNTSRTKHDDSSGEEDATSL